jgi:CRISPR/Cas system-associated endoribonuclease Cas2
MKKVLYISYDLKEDGNYKILIDKLENKFKVRHVLKSVWTVKLPEKYSVDDVHNMLSKYVDKNDGIVVVEAIAQYFHNTIEDPHKIDP